MARPAKPMLPALDECRDGALSLDDAAAFLAVCKREVEKMIGRGELLPVYHGRKPRLLKAHLIERLARELEAAREKDEAEHGATRRPDPGAIGSER